MTKQQSTINNTTSQLYFAWTAFQRRQVSMAPYCGFQTVFMPVEKRTGRVAKALTYLRHSWTMLNMLRQQRPTVVWIQLPQVPLLWIALLYRTMFNIDAKIVADCHNAMFRPPWSKVPLGISLLSRCSSVLAHNTDVLETAVALGVPRNRLTVMEDPPASFPPTATLGINIDLPRPWFVFPASFAADEPIAELLAAARETPEVSILITGNLKNCREPHLVANAPANVRFLGYLSRSDFEALIVNCDAVIAFTRFDGIQLSVCGEAVGCGKPMLASNTKTLRTLFPNGTCFVDSASPSDIANGFRTLTKQRQQLTTAMVQLRAKFLSEWLKNRWQPLMPLLQPSKQSDQTHIP
jgi:hypothetical protein